MLVQDVMLTKVFHCRETDTARQCAELMRNEKIGFVPVENARGEAVGVITDRDLTIRLVADARSFDTPVRELMSGGKLLTCLPEEDLHDLEERMASEQKSRALVVDKTGKLIGVVSLSDIAQQESQPARTARLMRKLTRRESVQLARPH